MSSTDGIKFLINLESRTSGTPADQKLKDIADAAHKANAAVEHGSHEFSALKSNIFSATMAAQLWEKALEKGAEMAVEAIHKVGETIKETVNIAAEERRVTMAMTNLLGGKEDAERAISYMEKFSELSEFGEEKTKAWGMELLNSGYRGQQWKDAMAAMVDAASMAPNKIAGAEEAMSSLVRMKFTGKLDARTLKGLRLDSRDVMSDLADALGMTPDAIKKGLDEGAIPAAKAYDAVLRALERKTGKQLGEAGLAAGKTLDAKLTHWREWPAKIMMAVQNSPGIDKIEKSFDKLLEAFDPEGPKGSKMVEGLDSLMSSVGDFIEGTDWNAVTKSIGGVATSLGAWIGPLGKIAELTLKVGEAVAKLPQAGEAIGEELAKLFNPVLRDQAIPASHGALKKSLEKEQAWAGDSLPPAMKSAMAEQEAADIRQKESEMAVKANNDAALAAALGGGGWGKGDGSPQPPKIEAKAEVVVHVNGGSGSPKEVGEAVKAGAKEGMTEALEKTALQAGTKSARRKH